MAHYRTENWSRWSALWSFFLVAMIPLAASQRAYSDDRDFARQVRQLVGQLNDDRAAERQQAEDELLDLAGNSVAANKRLLDALPEPSQNFPPGVQEHLRHIRKTIELRAANSAVAATHMTLNGSAMPLADALIAIQRQTGNRLLDRREQFGGGTDPIKVSPDFKDEAFWPAIDQLLDEAMLNVYDYSGEDALALVDREMTTPPRFGRAQYCGPFRFEVVEVQSQRSFHDPDRQSLRVQLGIMWEPRLRPIALSQPLKKIVVVGEEGYQIDPLSPEAVLDVEVRDGSQGTELLLPLRLPPRSVEVIASLKGELIALIPGERAVFRFGDLAHAAGKSERQGGVQVTIDSVRKNNEVWEIHMRLQLDDAKGSLQSHRAWVFQNLSYLVDEKDETIDNAGFETTRQTSTEVGIAYFFDLPNGLDGLTWVYETPASIVRLPVTYELKDIELP